MSFRENLLIVACASGFLFLALMSLSYAVVVFLVHSPWPKHRRDIPFSERASLSWICMIATSCYHLSIFFFASFLTSLLLPEETDPWQTFLIVMMGFTVTILSASFFIGSFAFNDIDEDEDDYRDPPDDPDPEPPWWPGFERDLRNWQNNKKSSKDPNKVPSLH